MNAAWFESPKNIMYMEIDDFVRIFAKDLGIPNLRNQIEMFRESPSAEGIIIDGGNEISIQLFTPALAFSKPVEKGENIWAFMGEQYPCYCLEKTEPWRDNKYFGFTHKDCEYYPCHETMNPNNFNCLFCFCPLYCLGKNCGGNYIYHDNIKDCSKCMLPHLQASYGYIMNKYSEIITVLNKMDAEKPEPHESIQINK